MMPLNEHSQKRTLSNGEKTFDWLTYGGLAGAGTFIVTVPVTDWIQHGAGEKYYRTASNWMSTKGLKFLPAASRQGVAKELVKTTALMMGGNLMLAPIWGAEQIHAPIANGINRLTGDPTPPEAISEKPQQTVRSLLEGRIAAFTAVFAGFFVASKFFGPQMASFENAMGRAAAGFMKKPANEASKAFRYGKIGALDVFATATAAGLLYVASRFFAKSNAKEETTAVQQQAFAKETQMHQGALESNVSTTPLAQQPPTKPSASIQQASHEGMAQNATQLALS